MTGGEFINGGNSNSIYQSYCGSSGLYGIYPVPEGIFSLPFENKKHEIFHIQFDDDPPGPNLVCNYKSLLYSSIDMSANQGLGEVVFKDSVLVSGCLQTACANRHANGRDWWVLLPDNVENRFYRFLSTPEGLHGPWIQDIENPTIVDSFFYLGWNEFSPDGRRLLINDIQSGTAIYDFDRCTGLLSNLRHIPANIDSFGYGYAAVFSPDSRFVYVVKGNFGTIEQFDLNASDLTGSRITAAVWDSVYYIIPSSGTHKQTFFSFFQHGPDGKLYNWAGDTPFMHVMDFPNRKGETCNVRQRAIELPYFTFAANAYYPNYRLGPIDGSPCDTLGIDNRPVALFRYDIEDTLAPLQVSFTDLSYYEPNSWHWDFGDGAASPDTNPMHAFPKAGAYHVCLTAANANAADTYCRQVLVGTVGVPDLPVLPRVSVYPNPCADYLTVEQPALLQHKPQFTLADAFGRRVLQQTLSDFTQYLDLRSLPPGVYFWQYRFGSQLAQEGRVVKM